MCTNQDDNSEKCLNTIKTCEPDEDVCKTEIRWGKFVLNLSRVLQNLMIDFNSRKHSILGFWSTQTVLCLQELCYKEEVSSNSLKIYALLYTHLVRRLELFRMLLGRSLQLLRYCKIQVKQNLLHKLIIHYNLLEWKFKNFFSYGHCCNSICIHHQ